MGKGRQRRGPQRLGPGRDGEGRAATLPPPGAIAGVANYSAGLGRAGLRGAAASRGTDRSDRVTESRGAGGGGQRLDRKGPPAPSWPARRGGSLGLAAPLVQLGLAAGRRLGARSRTR